MAGGGMAAAGPAPGPAVGPPAANNLGDLFSLSGGAGLTSGYVEPKSVSERNLREVWP